MLPDMRLEKPEEPRLVETILPAEVWADQRLLDMQPVKVKETNKPE